MHNRQGELYINLKWISNSTVDGSSCYPDPLSVEWKLRPHTDGGRRTSSGEIDEQASETKISGRAARWRRMKEATKKRIRKDLDILGVISLFLANIYWLSRLTIILCCGHTQSPAERLRARIARSTEGRLSSWQTHATTESNDFAFAFAVAAVRREATTRPGRADKANRGRARQMNAKKEGK